MAFFPAVYNAATTCILTVGGLTDYDDGQLNGAMAGRISRGTKSRGLPGALRTATDEAIISTPWPIRRDTLDNLNLPPTTALYAPHRPCLWMALKYPRDNTKYHATNPLHTCIMPDKT